MSFEASDVAYTGEQKEAEMMTCFQLERQETELSTQLFWWAKMAGYVRLNHHTNLSWIEVTLDLDLRVSTYREMRVEHGQATAGQITDKAPWTPVQRPI
jgi:hypothetical protein